MSYSKKFANFHANSTYVPKNNPCSNPIIVADASSFPPMIPYTYLCTFLASPNQYLSNSIQFAQSPCMAAGSQFWSLGTFSELSNLQYGQPITLQSIFAFPGQYMAANVPGAPANGAVAFQQDSYNWYIYGVDGNGNFITSGSVIQDGQTSYQIVLAPTQNISNGLYGDFLTFNSNIFSGGFEPSLYQISSLQQTNSPPSSETPVPSQIIWTLNFNWTISYTQIIGNNNGQNYLCNSTASPPVGTGGAPQISPWYNPQIGPALSTFYVNKEEAPSNPFSSEIFETVPTNNYNTGYSYWLLIWESLNPQWGDTVYIQANNINSFVGTSVNAANNAFFYNPAFNANFSYMEAVGQGSPAWTPSMTANPIGSFRMISADGYSGSIPFYQNILNSGNGLNVYFQANQGRSENQYLSIGGGKWSPNMNNNPYSWTLQPVNNSNNPAPTYTPPNGYTGVDNAFESGGSITLQILHTISTLGEFLV